jgi:hypothetical protein
MPGFEWAAAGGAAAAGTVACICCRAQVGGWQADPAAMHGLRRIEVHTRSSRCRVHKLMKGDKADATVSTVREERKKKS